LVGILRSHRGPFSKACDGGRHDILADLFKRQRAGHWQQGTVDPIEEEGVKKLQDNVHLGGDQANARSSARCLCVSAGQMYADRERCREALIKSKSEMAS